MKSTSFPPLVVTPTLAEHGHHWRVLRRRTREVIDRSRGRPAFRQFLFDALARLDSAAFDRLLGQFPRDDQWADPVLRRALLGHIQQLPPRERRTWSTEEARYSRAPTGPAALETTARCAAPLRRTRPRSRARARSRRSGRRGSSDPYPEPSARPAVSEGGSRV
jgi:hypothetical protein